MGSNPAWDRVSKVITFFFPFLKSVTFFGKSGLKLNFEHCGNHKKEVFWIFLSNFGCYNSSSCTVLLAAFWALWLGTNRRLSLLRITNYAVFFHPTPLAHYGKGSKWIYDHTEPLRSCFLTSLQPLLATEKPPFSTTTPPDAQTPGSSLESSEQAYLGWKLFKCDLFTGGSGQNHPRHLFLKSGAS